MKFANTSRVALWHEPTKVRASGGPAPASGPDSANRKPRANAPDVATAFPPPPSEFEVASLKPSAPLPAGGGRGGAGVYENDRLTRQNATLTQLINTAWNIYKPRPDRGPAEVCGHGSL
jgi:hypothetical protein